MRFYDRVLYDHDKSRRPWLVVEQGDESDDGYRRHLVAPDPRFMAARVESVARSTPFDIEPVFNFLWNRDKRWSWDRDAACIRPPFDRCWMEYRTLSLDDTFGFGAQIGYFPEISERVKLSLFSDSNVNGERRVVLEGDCELSITESGYFGGLREYKLFGNAIGGWRDRAEAALDDILRPVVMALSLLNCKNVSVVEAPDTRSRQQRRADERTSAPRTVFKTLSVGGFAKNTNTPQNDGDHGLERSLHICRGHFSEYTEERPLFGKYSGRFWIPAHTRGVIDKGVVVKDYRVLPN